MSNRDYLIREAVESDFDAMISLFLEHYAPQETLLQSYFNKHKNEITEDLEKLLLERILTVARHCLKTSTNFVVVDRESNQIIGCLFADSYPSISVIPDPKHAIVANYRDCIKKMSKRSYISMRYPNIERSIDLKFLVVHVNHRRKGLSTALLREAIAWAKENHFDLMKGLFTSLYSKKAAISLGMESVYDCDINDFRGDDGSLAFADATPNNVVSLMVIYLKNNKTFNK